MWSRYALWSSPKRPEEKWVLGRTQTFSPESVPLFLTDGGTTQGLLGSHSVHCSRGLGYPSQRDTAGELQEACLPRSTLSVVQLKKLKDCLSHKLTQKVPIPGRETRGRQGPVCIRYKTNTGLGSSRATGRIPFCCLMSASIWKSYGTLLCFDFSYL